MNGIRECYLDENDLGASMSRLSQCADGGSCPHTVRLRTPMHLGIDILMNVGIRCEVNGNCEKPEVRCVYLSAAPRGNRRLVDPVVVEPKLRTLTPSLLGWADGQESAVTLATLVVLPGGQFAPDCRQAVFKTISAPPNSFGTVSAQCQVYRSNSGSSRITNVTGSARVAMHSRHLSTTNEKTAADGVLVAEDTLAEEISKIATLDLSSFAVVGDYIRYREIQRNEVVRLRDLLLASLQMRPHGATSNYLIWASPGSGKSFFVEEFVRTSLSGEWKNRTWNLTSPDVQSQLADRVTEIVGSEIPAFTFVDEVDAPTAPTGTAESLMRLLGRKSDEDHNMYVTCVVGSFGESCQEMVQELIKRDKKFKDCFDRIPEDNRFTIGSMDSMDSVAVFASTVARLFKKNARTLKQIDLAALYYVAAMTGTYRTARQLSDLAKSASERCTGESLLWSHLMAPEDQVRRSTFEEEHVHAFKALLGRLVPVKM